MEVASMEAASSADLTTYRKNEKDMEKLFRRVLVPVQVLSIKISWQLHSIVKIGKGFLNVCNFATVGLLY